MAAAFLVTAVRASADHIPYTRGVVFAAGGESTINEFAAGGALKEKLMTTTDTFFNGGMCFDSEGNLYSTNFDANGMTKFNAQGGVLAADFGSGFDADPESCVVDASNNIYVGQSDGDADILKFDTDGNLLARFDAATENRGTDWIDLAADRCTMYYTSEGASVKRFNVCTGAQLADFATGFSTDPCDGLRIRPNGEVLVACTSRVFRLSASGTVMRTYTVPNTSLLFALTLDPDARTFWVGDLNDGTIARLTIETGQLFTLFDGMANTALGGLAVFGELRVGQDAARPTCNLTGIGTSGGKKFIEVTVRDPGTGLKRVTVTKAANATTMTTGFSMGTTDAVVVRATKVDNNATSQLALEAEDMVGNITRCDPVITVVVRGRPAAQTYTNLPGAEHQLSIVNGAPGLRRLKITVNGHAFNVTGLRDGEARTLDVASAMEPGDDNTITLRGFGKRTASATVVIHD
ncbi:MAG: hypothetical protein ABR583_09715 [Gaiellaceae bacterium]